MIGTSANDADIDSIALIPSGIAIDDIDSRPGVEIVDSAFSVYFPYLVVMQRKPLAKHCQARADCRDSD